MKFFLTTCLVFLISVGVKAQYFATNLPDDNISGSFYESPLIYQFESTVLPEKAILGFKIKWDSIGDVWGDTLLRINQRALQDADGWLCVEETAVKTGDGSWLPSSKTAITNKSSWPADKINIPNTKISYQWDITNASWKVLEKIEYLKNPDSTLKERRVFKGESIIPDSLEVFVEDDYWDNLLRARRYRDENLGVWKIRDSFVYFFANDDICDHFVDFKLVDGALVYNHLFEHEYYSNADNFEVRINKRINTPWGPAWTATGSYYNQIVDGITKRKFQTYFTDYKTHLRHLNQYDNNWQPQKFVTDFLPSLQPQPDSSTQKTFFYNAAGLLSEIVISKKTGSQDFKPAEKWVFQAALSTGAKEIINQKDVIKAFWITPDWAQVTLQRQNLTSDPLTIRIFDATGRLVLSDKMVNDEYSAYLPSITNGVLYIQVCTPNNYISTKLVK